MASPECNQGGNVVVETVGALCARDYKGVGSQYVSEGKCIVQEAVCIGNGQLNQISMAEQSNCLDCMHDRQAVLTNGKPPRKYIVRRLTPLECCRLQGFPDWWEDDVEGSDSARYKMWGNGMALPNMLHVMRGIARVEGVAMSDMIRRDGLLEFARNHVNGMIDVNDIARLSAIKTECGQERDAEAER